MLETLVGAALMCGSLSLVIILFTKFFMRSESYDEMLAKRKRQENELLGPKPSKKEKTKKEKSKVKKVKPMEDVVKPKAEVKPMVVEEEVLADEEESDIVEEVASGIEAQREPVTSRRSKKKNRKWKNVSFSDDGEPMNGHDEVEEVKPILLNKDERSPVLSAAEPMVHVRPPGKDTLELKQEQELVNGGSENGSSKKKKKKGRKSTEEEVEKAFQQPVSQTHAQQQQQQTSQSQVQTSHLQSQPKSMEPVVDVIEKSTATLSNAEGSSKKKKKTDKRSDPTPPVKATKDVKDVNGIGEEAQNLIRVVDLTPMSRVELKALATTLVEKGGHGLVEPDEMTLSEMRALRATEAVLRKELLQERASLASVTNSAKERMTAQNAKIMELQQELGRSTALTQEARQMRDENERLKTSLKEMENRMKIITDQFALNASQLDTTERAKKALEVQVDRLREQLKSYEKRLHEGTAHIDSQLAAAKNACASAEREARDSRRELEAANSALTFERTSAQERVSALEREVSGLQLALQSSKAERRGAAEGQEDPVQRNAATAAAAAAAAAATAAAAPRNEQLEKAPPQGQPLKEKDGKITDLESEVQRLNQQIDNQRQKNNQLETRLTASSERLEVAEKEANKVTQLSQSVRTKEHEVSMLKHELEGLRRENELLKNTSGSADSEKWQAEIDALRSKNNELREKNWKTVEALNAAQTEADRRVKEAGESARGEVRDLKASLRRLESEATANHGWRSMAEQAEAAQREAEEQLTHYKAALVETETILRDLEKSVETEEKKWQMTLQASEQECERARKELANAYGELKRTGASREMEDKLETTETTLVEVERERDTLAEQLEAAQAALETATGALESTTAHQRAEVTALRKELEMERKSKKELAQQATKFSALVKIGQDALREEQQLVVKLQSQLRAKGGKTAS